MLLDTASGVAINPAAAIGAYAALCHAIGRPFAFPGAPDSLWEMVDAGLLAEAFDWAFDSPAAAGQTFNITMATCWCWPTPGRTFPRRWAWRTAAHTRRLADLFATPESQAAWRDLAQTHDLRIDSLPALLGESHHYVDLLLSARIAGKAVPVLLSTIKLRQAGFAGCKDSLQSLIDNIRNMIALKLLPPLPGVA